MSKKVKNILLLLGLFLLFSGCMSQSGEAFFTLPQLSDDYVALQTAINEAMSALGTGAEYAAPSAGSNMQTIQLQDLDGDGVRESAVAFFRVLGEEKPLKIYVFRQDQVTGEYEVCWTIEGDGTAIYSIAYENLGGSEDRELVVSWQISAQVRSLAVYSLQPDNEVVELMRSGYARGAVVDLDRDNEKEIVLVQLDTAENNSRAELYNYENGLMVLSSAAPLSLGVTTAQTAKEGVLTNLAPALFVSSDYGENGGYITDVITLRDGALVNLTLDETTGVSAANIRYYKDFQDANGADINSDGILELPIPRTLPMLEETGQQMYLLDWNQYGPNGEITRVCTTFHCYDDGWYLVLPENWQGEIAAARRDSSTASVTERAVVFYHWTEEMAQARAEARAAAEADPEAETDPGPSPEAFLTVYRLTGANRTLRAKRDERFILFESSDVIYAARFQDASWACGLDNDTLRERFNRVRVNWSAES